jgi:hypothetical protein
VQLERRFLRRPWVDKTLVIVVIVVVGACCTLVNRLLCCLDCHGGCR